jgi:hypothetical protein
MAKRDGYKIFVEPQEKAELDAYLARIQLGHKEALTQMVRQFLRADPVYQMFMLGLVPKGYEQEIAALMVLRASGQDVSVRQQLLDAATASLVRIGAGEAASQIAAASTQPKEKRRPGPRPH